MADDVTEIIVDVKDMEWVDDCPSNEENEENNETDSNVQDNERLKIKIEPYELSPSSLSLEKKLSSNNRKTTEDHVQTVEQFCSEHYCSEKCTEKFTIDEILQLRSACEALNEYVDGTNRLDLVILSMIRVLVRTHKVKRRRIKRRGEKNKETDVETARQKNTCNFMVEGQSVCRTFFLFVHNIGLKRWSRLMKTYKNEGLVEKYHGLCNRKPANTLPFESVQFVVDFLQKYCGERAVSVSNRHSKKHSVLKVLPIGETKTSVYEKYVKACHEKGGFYRTVSKISFNRIWRQCCPNVVTQKPRCDSKAQVEKLNNQIKCDVTETIIEMI